MSSAGQQAGAEAEVRRANEIFAATLDPGHKVARQAQVHTAGLLTRIGRLDEADAIFSRLPKAVSPHPFEAERFDVVLGELRTAQGRHDEAQQLLKRAADGLAKNPIKIWHPRALSALGAAQLEAGKATEALKTLQQARAAFEELQPNMSPQRADLLVNIARSQIVLGDAHEAKASAEAAAAFWNSFDHTTRNSGVASLWHARALVAAGNRKMAAEAANRAAAALKQSGLPSDLTLLAETRREIHSRVSP